MPRMRRLTILVALLLALAVPLDAAVFAVVTQVFGDNSCRTFAWDPERNCHGVPTIWCDPTRPTCEAMTAEWSIPSCVVEGDGPPPRDSKYE